jgi:hypothetical protein
VPRISIAASAPGWESSIKALASVPREIKTEVSRRGGRTLAEPLAREIRAVGNAQGSHAGRVADTVKSGMKSGTPSVTAGGLPYTMGSEWGGGLRRTTYYSTSRLGRRYLVVRRATTKQFRPHRGGEGYWFTPTIQEGRGRDAVLKGWAELVDDVIGSW